MVSYYKIFTCLNVFRKRLKGNIKCISGGYCVSVFRFYKLCASSVNYVPELEKMMQFLF
jgi:hypothetical protein